jgi:hypothetical protein
METHVKVLGFLHIILGSLGVLASGFFMLLFGGIASLIGVNANPEDAAIAIPIIGVIGTGIAMFILALSVPGIIVGVGLLKFRAWARVLGLILSILLLIHVPFGTIVGVYGLWVLLTAETEQIFRARA